MVNDTPFLPTWSTLTSIPTSCSRAITNYLWSSFFCGYMRWNSRNNSNNNRSSNNNTHNKNITQCFYMLIFKRPLRLFSNISYQRIDSIVIHIFFYYRYCNFLIIFLIVIRCILVFISIHATSFIKAFYSYYYNLLS